LKSFVINNAFSPSLPKIRVKVQSFIEYTTEVLIHNNRTGYVLGGRNLLKYI